MSLKQEIETWVQALAAYDNREYEEALRVFDSIADTSKILFNCGVIHATLGEHDRAVECYQRAIALDQYLAVAYFQQGVSNFLVGDFEEALANFNDTLLYLRGNTYIDYDQLGLKFRLFSCEVLFNRGLCYIYLQQEKPGMQDFGYAVKEKMTADHDVIDDAIREKADGYTVFSIPVGVVYRPNEAKVKNLKTKDYLGKARLIATSNTNNTSTGFVSAERKQALQIEMAAKDDRPIENISFAATNLVQRNLSSRRGREQSAPPSMNRNMFPPTPPPESDKPSRSGHHSTGSTSLNARSSSLRRPSLGLSVPTRAEAEAPRNDFRPDILRKAQTTDSASTQEQTAWALQANSSPSRPGTVRTASEPRGASHRQQMGSQRPQLFRETTPQRYDNLAEDDTCDDVYNLYHRQPQANNSRKAGGRRPVQQQQYIDEEDEFAEQPTEEDIIEDDGFDFAVNGADVPAHRSLGSVPVRTSSRRPGLSKIRVKVHANEDTRYIMIGPTIEYGDLESKIREKFGIKDRLKIRMQDDGDMITMGDQDDLDMLLASVRSIARKERNEMGKMEVWIQEV